MDRRQTDDIGQMSGRTRIPFIHSDKVVYHKTLNNSKWNFDVEIQCMMTDLHNFYKLINFTFVRTGYNILVAKITIYFSKSIWIKPCTFSSHCNTVIKISLSLSQSDPIKRFPLFYSETIMLSIWNMETTMKYCNNVILAIVYDTNMQAV